MPAASSIEDIVRALHKTTENLSRAVASGDANLAESLLEDRGTAIQDLLQRAPAGALANAQLAEIEGIIARGQEAAEKLRARRETARALIGGVEAERRRLANWMPTGPSARTRMDLTG